MKSSSQLSLTGMQLKVKMCWDLESMKLHVEASKWKLGRPDQVKK